MEISIPIQDEEIAEHGLEGPEGRNISLVQARLHERELPKEEFTNRERARLVVIGLPWQLGILILSLLDILLLLISLFLGKSSDDNLAITAATWLILTGYLVDIIVRLYVFHLYLFFKNAGNIFDFSVVVLSVTLTAFGSQFGNGVGFTRIFRAAYRVGITLRIMRSTSKFSQMGTGAAGQAARNVTSMNKRRYVDLRHNFDLDLTYINDEIIAMGVPARGFVALYRNPSGEVVRFFTSRHKDHYRIYNFCPELPYPSKLFDDRVRCYDVQDHTPPPMNTLIEFLEDAGAFTAETRGHAADEPKNVIAVHCRGGKGRTGSAVCSWLLYSKFSVDAPTALRYFAETRTELRKGSKKLQGVDTPSQKRYIVQLDQWLTRTGAYHGTEVPLRPIPDTRIALNHLTVSGYFARPHDERGPLVAAVHQNGPGGGQIIFVSPPLNSTTVMTNELVFDLKGFVVGGDIRVTVFEQGPLKKGVAQGLVLADAPGLPKGPKDLSKRKIAGKEPGVLFYFLFHTEFVDHTVVKKDVGVVKGGGGGAGELAVPMPMMDKAFHNKRKRYDPCGIAVLSTSPAAAPPVAPVAALKAVPTHPTSPPPPLPPRNPLTKGGGHNVDLDAEGSPEEPPASLPSPPGESKLPVAASLILMPEPELEPRFEEVEEQEDPLGLHTLHRAASMAVEDAVTAIHQSASGFFL